MTGTLSATVRPAIIDDAEAIPRVHIASWQVAYRGQIPDAYLNGLANEMPRRIEFWRSALQRAPEQGRRLFVAERDGFVVGFLSCGPSEDPDRDSETGEIYAIYLHPSAWGTGTGRALFERGEETLQELGFTKATLWVLDTNARGRGFYEAMGWHADGAKKDEERGTFTLHEVRYRRDPL